VALADKHVLDPKLLWRDGVVLFDQRDKETFAYIQMRGQKMHIEIRGQYRDFLMHFVLYYIAMLFREDKSSLVKAKVMKRIFVDEKPEMLDVELMHKLSNETSRNDYMASIDKERVIMANIYNINGGVHGSNLGNHGTVNNYSNVVKYLEQTKEILKNLDDSKSKSLLDEVEGILDKKEESDTWLKKAGKIKDKVVGYASDVVKIDKAGQAVHDIAQSEAAMNLIEMCKDIF